jgi:hypothetical protein
MARNSSRAFRKTAAWVIANSDGICGICGHGGGRTVDHIVSFRDWPTDELGQPLPGLDDPDNLRPSHGTRGIAEANPCHECDPQRWPRGRLCNQSRGSGTKPVTLTEPHSQNW